MAILPASLVVSTNSATSLSGINIKSNATTEPIAMEVKRSNLRASLISFHREMP